LTGKVYNQHARILKRRACYSRQGGSYLGRKGYKLAPERKSLGDVERCFIAGNGPHGNQTILSKEKRRNNAGLYIKKEGLATIRTPGAKEKLKPNYKGENQMKSQPVIVPSYKV